MKTATLIARPRDRTIELSLDSVGQLFNSLDPSPFHERDLARDAEDFLVGWAKEHPTDARLHLVLHFRRDPGITTGIQKAINNYFDYRASQTRATLRGLLRQGRVSLLIGISFLTGCLLLAELLAQTSHGSLLRLLQESLTIGGWVAMWRPIQIYLYEWWPLARQVRLYRRMSRMDVEIRAPQALRATGA
jgi:hypothetical protein